MNHEDISAKDVCKELAELFGSPCDYSPIDEIMLKMKNVKKCAANKSTKNVGIDFLYTN